MNVSETKQQIHSVIAAAESALINETDRTRRTHIITQARRSILKIHKEFKRQIDARASKTVWPPHRRFAIHEREGLEQHLAVLTQNALQIVDSWTIDER